MAATANTVPAAAEKRVRRFIDHLRHKNTFGLLGVEVTRKAGPSANNSNARLQLPQVRAIRNGRAISSPGETSAATIPRRAR